MTTNNNSFKILIKQYVSLLQAKMESNDMKLLKETNPDEYKQKLDNYVPKFREEYPFLYRMIINNNDLSMLDTFLNNIADIDNGNKTLNDARNDLGQILHDKYVNK
jgi:hypothetical protein